MHYVATCSVTSSDAGVCSLFDAVLYILRCLLSKTSQRHSLHLDTASGQDRLVPAERLGGHNLVGGATLHSRDRPPCSLSHVAVHTHKHSLAQAKLLRRRQERRRDGDEEDERLLPFAFVD